jgi:hypothetical protein
VFFDWKNPLPFFCLFSEGKKMKPARHGVAHKGGDGKRLRFMARSAASYILMLDEQSSQAQNMLHAPQVRFINPPFQMKHCFTIVPQYEASSASFPI